MFLVDWHRLLELDFGKIGFITGVISLIIAILNYRRDRSKVVVALQWDAGLRRDHQRKVVEKWGMIYVTNTGRRPACITMVWLEGPGGKNSISLLMDEHGLNPIEKRISEGDSPIAIKIPQDFRLQQYSKNWQEIRAVALDSLGKRYTSKKLTTPPSWAAQP